MTNKKQKIKLVVIGGGTGTHVVVQGLKRYPIDLTAVISMADSGGSTGRLRDEFGFQPVGDLRQALAALASDETHEWIRKLLLYRFSKGSGLEGHNLGNLMLTALQDMAGSTPMALDIARSVFNLEGHIYPITTKNIQLVVEYEDGTVEIGERVLDEKHGGKRISAIKTSPRCEIYDKAREAIVTADCVVIGPGDLYGSILPNLVVEGITETFAATRAKLVYVMNLMTRYTQTHNYSAADHLAQIETHIGRAVDYVIVNSAVLPPDVITRYAAGHEYPVTDNLGKNHGIIRKELLTANTGMFIRHDPDQLAAQILQLCQEMK